MKKAVLALSILLALAAGSAMGKTKYFKPKDIDKIVRNMTLEEKAGLCVGDMFERSGTVTRGFDKYGIPRIMVLDGPVGLHYLDPIKEDGTYGVTSFPITASLGSSWNTELLENMGSTMADEAKGFGVDVLLGPAMNIQRNPLCGRNFEYVSEDPLLTGKVAAALTKGIAQKGVGVSMKHFAGNDQETNRGNVDDHMSRRALREIYLKGFEIGVKEADPMTMMTSYNRINGHSSSENYDLLQTIARDEWGFGGIFMTDWGGGRDVAKQIHAGNDLMMPGGDDKVKALVKAVNEGRVSEADLDACCKRMLRFITRTNKYKNQGKDTFPEIDLARDARVSRETAIECMILLKNEENTLPLRKSGQVALFGVGSYDLWASGTGAARVVTDYKVQLWEGLRNSGVALNPEILSFYQKYVADDIASQPKTFGPLATPVSARETLLDLDMIRRAAETSDVAVYTIKRTAGEGEDRRLIKGDWYLSNTEEELLSKIAAAFHAKGKKLVVVLNSGGVIETASWKDKADAILNAWQSGLESGNAIAQVMTGEVNPSGKLPVTYPLNYFDLPSSWNFPYDYDAPKIDFSEMMAAMEKMKEAEERGETMEVPTFFMDDAAQEVKDPVRNIDYSEYEDDIYVGYRYFVTSKVPVSFPFGFGLSYTTFEYSNPSVERTVDGWKASITVKNTGKVAGKESVQLYVAAPHTIEKPAYELKAFAKTATLAPGDAETLTMTFSDYDLASFDESRSAWVTAPGGYEALFAASSEDIRQTAPFTVTSELEEKVHDVLAPVNEVNVLSFR